MVSNASRHTAATGKTPDKARASPQCPECGSSQIWKDGLRYTKNDDVQRYLCRCCGHRFSDTKIQVDVFKEGLELPDAVHNLGYLDTVDLASRKVGFQNPPLPLGEDVGSHDFTDIGKRINSFLPYTRERRVCATERVAKNLSHQRTRQKQAAGATTLSTMTEFAEQLKRDGYSEHTIKACIRYLDFMERKGINILRPEQVKSFIAEQNLQNHSKATYVTYYGIFAKVMHIQWTPPKYRYERKIPFIPLEEEVNDLIAGCGRKMAVFLRLLKETGARAGEALRLTWKDFDFVKGTVVINHPEKGSMPRILPISQTLRAMLNSLSRKNKRIFKASMNTMQSNFRNQRNRLAIKLRNPRLKQITFHTFRHFFATMLYAKTLNILKVQRALGHKNINNTTIYTHLIDFKSDEYEVQVAETVDEAKKLGEAGFDHYDTVDNCHLYRKRK